MVGDPSDRLGGSVVDDLLGIGDRRVPPAPEDPLRRYVEVHRLIAEGSVTAAHDVSDGGIAAAIAEMAIGGRLGAKATVPAAGRGLVAALANEAPGRLLLEAPAGRRDHVGDRLGAMGSRIGVVTGGPAIEIRVADPAGPQPPHAEPVTIELEAAVRAFTGRRGTV